MAQSYCTTRFANNRNNTNNHNLNQFQSHTSNMNNGRKTRNCAFCFQNKEPARVFTSHELKDACGNVICPQLSKHVCEVCGATGKMAHTRSYCPNIIAMRELCNTTTLTSRKFNLSSSQAATTSLVPGSTIGASSGSFSNSSTSSTYSNCEATKFHHQQLTRNDNYHKNPRATNFNGHQDRSNNATSTTTNDNNVNVANGPSSNTNGGVVIEISRDRRFRNMGLLTTSRYNSAGRLRRQPTGLQAQIRPSNNVQHEF